MLCLPVSCSYLVGRLLRLSHLVISQNEFEQLEKIYIQYSKYKICYIKGKTNILGNLLSFHKEDSYLISLA